MNSTEKTRLKERIEQEIAACQQAIEQLEPSAKPIQPDSAIGRISRADGMNDQGISSAALSNAREKLYKLTQSLEQLDQPGFGECRICGTAIAPERLAAIPESTRCARCAAR